LERAGIAKGFAVAVVIVIVVAGLASVFVASYLAKSASATSTSSASQAASATGPVGIVVSRTTVDKTNSDTSAGTTLYIYDVTLTGNSSSGQSVGPGLFILTGTSGASYNSSAVAVVSQVPATTLTSGQHASGEVGFLVPDSDQPSTLSYHDAALGVSESVADLPAPSRWVSSVSGVQATWPSNSDTANFFIGANLVNSTSDLYYSGGTIKVEVQITPYNDDDIIGVAVPDVRVTSVSVANPGFTVVSVSPSLPATITANNNTAVTNIVVTVAVPSSSVSAGTLSLSLSAT